MFVIIDGSLVLSTAFYATLPPMFYRAKTPKARSNVLSQVTRTLSGEIANGVLGMTRILFNLVEKVQPEYLAVAWDVDREETFRKKLYPGYKSKRAFTLPELRSQFGLMQRLLSELGIAQYRVEGYEANDVIATLAKKFEDQVPVKIYSKDQDLLQLVSQQTTMWLITKKHQDLCASVGINRQSANIPDNVFELTPDIVQRLYGLCPGQLSDVKALMGDKSDNIPGVYGIGEKTAIQLVQVFGSVESLYSTLEAMDIDEQVKTFKSLKIGLSHLDRLLAVPQAKDDLVGKMAALLSKKRVKLKCSVP